MATKKAKSTKSTKHSKKSAKKATKKTSKITFEKRTPAYYKTVAAGISRGKVPGSSGELIRARLVEGRLSTEDIIKEVHKRFKGSTAKASDVYWQRGRLKKEGIALKKETRAGN